MQLLIKTKEKGLQCSLNNNFRIQIESFLIKVFISNYFCQYREVQKNKIWVQKFLCPKAVTAVIFGLY